MRAWSRNCSRLQASSDYSPKPVQGEAKPNFAVAVGVGQTTSGAGETAQDSLIDPEVRDQADKKNEETKAKLSRAPNSIRAAVSLCKMLYAGTAWKRVATAHLLHPPADGPQFDRLLAAAMPDEWDTFEAALTEETEGSKQDQGGKDKGQEQDKSTTNAGAGETAQKGGSAENNDDGTEEDAAGRGALKTAAEERATAVLNYDPGVTIISPDSWDANALSMCTRGQVAHGSMGRFVAFLIQRVTKTPGSTRVRTSSCATHRLTRIG